MPSDFEPLIQTMREAQADCVAARMSEGWSWVEVGRDLDMSHQAARKRFAPYAVKSERRRGGQPTELR